MIETEPPPGYVLVPVKIEGIEVYKPAPVPIENQKEVVEFKCPRCGATTAFSAAAGGLTCTHCGYFEEPDAKAVGRQAVQNEFTVETMQKAEQGWGSERKEMVCQDCGAVTSIPAESLTHTCPFCGSNKVIQRQALQDVLRPRYLVPFKLDSKACQATVRQWLGSSWMTPASLKNIGTLEAFSGVYLPFWTFSSVTRADWKAEVGHTKTETYYEDGERKQRTVTEWRWESGNVNLNINDLVVEGTTRLSKILMKKVNQYDFNELTPYEPKYLAGLQAQAYDHPLEKAWETARQNMREQTRKACLGQCSTSQVRNFSMSLDFADESWRYLILPMYVAAYTYSGKKYQVMVNGQNGAIAGQRPVDWTKVWLVVGGIMAPGLLLGLIGLATILLGGIGVAIGGIGLFLLVVGLVISIIILVQVNGLDDI